ncbi:Crp/Fnr family transcriptional regulator [Conexibacter woesei]|uniref:Crp/Fnr family transcriptional regulator n=1 Tax=Conexibacter woesei TaxID=191495 RepID=UPI0004180FD2|nr:helix-turn-helix domain-containing protein [Conexibacter woesei]
MVSTISLIEADPDFADGLSPEAIERARSETRTRLQRLSPGPWDATAAMEPEVHHRGFLIVDGLLARDVEVLGRACTELLGPGDVMRPWQWDPEGSHVQAEVGWEVLDPTRLAVLDHSLIQRLTPFPTIGAELFSRGIRRAHALAVALAINHHQRVDERLCLTLWHLAERWGRVTPDGIVVELPLNHQRLSMLVGAHRPSVTTAIGDLARAGKVSRRDDGCWMVHGEPPDQLRHHRLAAALTG